MPRRPSSLPGLTLKERQALIMALEGLDIITIAERLDQSTKKIQRYLSNGVDKLSEWLQKDMADPPIRTIKEDILGFLNQRDGHRAIVHQLRLRPQNWACIVVLALVPKKSGEEPLNWVDSIVDIIHRNIRRTDIVVKWAPLEWVIYLPGVSSSQTEIIVNRMRQPLPIQYRIHIGWAIGSQNDSFDLTFETCHRKVVAQSVKRDLESYITNPLNM
jgi:hypothetical protein